MTATQGAEAQGRVRINKKEEKGEYQNRSREGEKSPRRALNIKGNMGESARRGKFRRR